MCDDDHEEKEKEKEKPNFDLKDVEDSNNQVVQVIFF